MNLIANCGKRIILIAWIVFIIFTFIFSFSYLLFVILILLHLFYKRAEREILDDDVDIIVSPIDANVIGIDIDENNQTILLTLKKSCFNILDSSEIRSIIKTPILKIFSINGLKYNDDFYCNAKNIVFNEKLSCIVKPSQYSVINIEDIAEARKGQRIGFLSSGIIEIKLPYNSTILVGLGDKILANSKLARLGD